MALQNKRSDIPGAEPNLIPGEIGHNRADDRLWLRAAGRRIGVDLDRWRRTAAPAEGPYGAPLGRVQNSVDWVADLIPAGVVNGVIAVDAPPSNAFGVPGFFVSALASNTLEPADTTLVEDFYVASDQITITKLAFRTTTPTAGPVRLALFSGDDRLFDALILAPRAGVNEVEVDQVLPRGAYRAALWTADALTIASVFGYRYEQGFELVESSNELEFIVRQRTSGDFSTGLYLAGASIALDTADQPGELKAVMMRWTLP